MNRFWTRAAFCLLALPMVAWAQVRVLGPKPPEDIARIVTLAPSLTEVVVALGATDRLVGVTRFDELPQVEKLPRVGGFLDPSVEKVLSLKPDLVLVQPSPGNQKPVETLAQLQVPVWVLPLDSVSSVVTAMREVGRVLKRREQAEALVAELENMRRRVQKAREGLPRKRVLLAYDFQPLVVAGPGSFADELLLDAGGINVCEVKSAWAMFPLEKAVTAAAEVVIDASDTSRGVDRLKALLRPSSPRFVKLPSKNLMHPGPRLAQGLEELFHLLHPGAPLP